MVFSSVVFLSAFLPAALGLSWLLRQHLKAQNGLLLALSLAFYAWGEGRYVALLALSAFGNAWLGRKAYEGKRWPGVAAAVLNVGVLAYFKYAGPLMKALGSGWTGPALPLGISFFTFQGLAYVLDAGRRETPPGTLLEGSLSICLFPQLVAGPIVRWREIAPAMAKREITWDGMARGFRRLIAGLSKKVLLADTLGKVADAAFTCPDPQRGAGLAWLGAAAFCLQLYLDFSGYSDMAVGLGRMLGFSFPENFDHPFRSASLREFWRQWHISLGRWFRDQVYIPLGGSRAGAGRTALNLLLVFALTGLWHGAGLTFLLWGLWNGLLVVLERSNALRFSAWPRAAARLATLLAVLLGFILFRADSLAAAGTYFLSLFGSASGAALLLALTPDAVLALLAAVPVILGFRRRVPETVLNAACLALLALCLLRLTASGYHPFLYFRF